jgi:hypothetical protein
MVLGVKHTMPNLPLPDDRRASLTARKATEDDTWF